MKKQATQITIDEIATGDVAATLDDVIAALPKDGRGNVVNGDELLCDVCKTARAVTVGAWGKKYCRRCASAK